MSATECHTYGTSVNGNVGSCYIGCITTAIYISYAGASLVDYVNYGSAVYGSSITTAIDIARNLSNISSCGMTYCNLRVTIYYSCCTQASAKYAAAYSTVGYSNNRIITLIVFGVTIWSLITGTIDITYVPIVVCVLIDSYLDSATN